jgi:L-histidine N-alpha-methyltransferase
MHALAPEDIVELGAGSATKTRRLLEARNGLRQSIRYVPIDIDEVTIQATATRLLADYPFLHVRALVGDFERHLQHVPASVGRRLVLFLGSTIGNPIAPRRRLLTGCVPSFVRDSSSSASIVKDVKVLGRHDDASGVTHEFNHNILRGEPGSGR